MFKKLLILMALLATTAFTVVLGEDFDFSFLFSDPTEVIVATTVAPTATLEEVVNATFTSTELPTETSTPEPTSTTLPTETATETSTPTFTPTFTPTNTATPVIYQFSAQTGSPVYTTNFVHTTEGCNWVGIAGQIFDSNGDPLTNYVVKVSGTYNGASVNILALTGLVTNLPYGPGSYEVVIGSKTLDSTNSLNIQLFDPTGLEASAVIPLTTYASCSKNLTILNFIQK